MSVHIKRRKVEKLTSPRHRGEMLRQDAEGGRSLMMQKVLLTPEKEVESSVQRTRLFRLLAKPRTGYARSLWTVVAWIILFLWRW
jgi:hypothetical protein